jgi:hypothetical protein
MELTLMLFLIAVIVINAIPAFMPPTWVLLAYYSRGSGVDLLVLAVLGAVCSTIGRIVLAKWSGPVTYRFFSKSMARNAEFAHEEAAKHPGAEFVSSFVYALSPLPSNTVFIVTGAANLRLLPIAGGFFAGRVISYYLIMNLVRFSMYQLGRMFSFYDPTAWVLDFLGIALSLLVFTIDWRGLLQRKPGKKA